MVKQQNGVYVLFRMYHLKETFDSTIMVVVKSLSTFGGLLDDLGTYVVVPYYLKKVLHSCDLLFSFFQLYRAVYL